MGSLEGAIMTLAHMPADAGRQARMPVPLLQNAARRMASSPDRKRCRIAGSRKASPVLFKFIFAFSFMNLRF